MLDDRIAEAERNRDRRDVRRDGPYGDHGPEPGDGNGREPQHADDQKRRHAGDGAPDDPAKPPPIVSLCHRPVVPSEHRKNGDSGHRLRGSAPKRKDLIERRQYRAEFEMLLLAGRERDELGKRPDRERAAEPVQNQPRAAPEAARGDRLWKPKIEVVAHRQMQRRDRKQRPDDGLLRVWHRRGWIDRARQEEQAHRDAGGVRPACDRLIGAEHGDERCYHAPHDAVKQQRTTQTERLGTVRRHDRQRDGGLAVGAPDGHRVGRSPHVPTDQIGREAFGPPIAVDRGDAVAIAQRAGGGTVRRDARDERAAGPHGGPAEHPRAVAGGRDRRSGDDRAHRDNRAHGERKHAKPGGCLQLNRT